MPLRSLQAASPIVREIDALLARLAETCAYRFWARRSTIAMMAEICTPLFTA